MHNIIVDRITIDERICNGKPTIRGTRVAVQTILEFLSCGDSIEEILEAYPMLRLEDVQAAMAFAALMMSRSYQVIPLSSINTA